MDICEHIDGCSRPATSSVEIEGEDGVRRHAGLCDTHRAAVDRKVQGGLMTLQMLEIRCPRCDAHAPEGLMWHDCANPSPQPPDAEI